MTFTQRCFFQLNPQGGYMHNWHLDLIADQLEACRRREIRRLIINVPPRSMKSILASVAFPAFWLGHDPSAQILCASYGQDLAEKLSLDCRQVIGSDWFRAIFPTRLSRTRNAAHEFITTANGSRMATSVGGVVTGRGADLIIIDDPLKPEEAVSDLQRQKVNDWYDSTLFSRLNSKDQGVIVVIMQRLHLNDLVGHLAERGGWEVLSLPAIAEGPEEWHFRTMQGPQCHMRTPGDLLHPERESQAVLNELRSNLGEYDFASQYQQSPVPKGGALVKENWLMVYDPLQQPEHFDQMILSWDTANKPSEFADFSVCTAWGVKGKAIYLVDVLRKKLDYPGLKQAVKEMSERWRPTKVLIEDKASGTQLVQELFSEGVSGVEGVKPEGDKIMRMHAQTGFFEQGRVYLPSQAPWLEDYRKELLSFPVGKMDDQVDATSQALKWIHQHGQEAGIMTYYRSEARKMFEAGELGIKNEEEINAMYENFWESEEDHVKNRDHRGPDNRLLPHFYPPGHQLWKPKPPNVA
ncbi:phage terminase large subunit [Geothrix terrae]|uniref:phage terminase large subunit n=1 Tax=Geothrix terrae TaxID=2922720 RepID=UPI001FAB4238|nr:phage terminase large subunit [Geothrix terrae]